MSSRLKIVIGAGLVVSVVGFLLFRPDTLFTDVRADESLEEAFAAPAPTNPPATTVGEVPATTAPAAPVNGASSTTNTPAEVEQLSTGNFYGIDHRASGSAGVYRSGDSYVLRFEDDTDIQNGPDLYVWVLPDADYEGGIPTEYIDLGTLTGNVGGQNYDLPPEFDPDVHRSVLIWCLRFAVPFAAVPLVPIG